ncbi:hypothetical protein P691DRAFT_804938 [Macrolepiota fuliginosa MF-IS2]|uniref:Uncharacterized protein n=1 Tax=Macrolepiota fuliginosa MF-IS2 TaxID=1400762 RepID=A0A9P6C1T1_9AGAR|nr:hypothetical protein P691DRAFT_804938 [Macrolepiota fuliginosa MF-IS2]
MSMKSNTKRQLVSVPAPLEPDSDSDFTPGAYILEESATLKKGSPTKRKRRSEVLTNLSGRTKQKRKFYHRAPDGPNELLKCFALDDLSPDSESEPESAVRRGKQRTVSSDRESEPDSSSPVVLKSFAALSGIRSRRSRSSGPTHSPEKLTTEDSATESDSEEDTSRKPGAFKLPDRKQANEDSSSTESDSGDEVLMPAAKPLKVESADRGSATESDTEEDGEESDVYDLKPRPGFPLALGQQWQGPLILGEKTGTQVPAAINTYLRDYQREGVKFFWNRYEEGRGGLLGDDMGLGKTIQVISFLSAIMRKSGVATDKNRRRKHISGLQDLKAWKERRELPPANAIWPTCLIIAPSTVVHNWEREFDTWGYFEVGLYTGSRKEREPVLHEFKMGRLDVVVTSFDIARKDIDLLDSLAWSCVFVDEVHRVKNVSSKLTAALHQFSCIRRFGLTGTTIQNSYQEMWTILDWANPGRLGTSSQWQRLIVKPLITGQSTAATEEERAKAQTVAVVLKNKLLPHFFLRRTKDVIQNQLPKKTDQVVFCPLSPKQITAYKHLLNMDAVQNLIHRDHPCPCGSGRSRKACCHPFVAGDVFRYMSILIKLSNHLALILPGPNDSPEQTARNRALTAITFPGGDAPKYGTAMMQPQYCGKWATLEILLREWHKDPSNKVLIFTKSVKLLDMLDFHLKSRGYGFIKLEGCTKQSERMPMVDKFHCDPKVFVFLISTLAGGTGLNLTGANKVVIFDPNWNPAHDLQAMDRAFRFGQTRDVSVYRLLGAGSVEELIYARQIYKQQQMEIGYNASIQTRYFEGIQGDNSKRGELFGIENIFKLHEDRLATKMAIEKANLAELDWALANMGRGRSRKTNKVAVEMVEADAGVGKEDSTLKGLGALLFDDEAPQLSNLNEEDSIQTILNTVGVKYSHLNDEILLPSRIEEERTRKSLMKTRQKRKSKGGQEGEEENKQKELWPPARKHHKPRLQMSPEEQLVSRHSALVQLGMINSPQEIPAFAKEFARQPIDAQREIIAELDKWARMQEAESDHESPPR